MSARVCAYFPVFNDIDALRFSIKKTNEFGISDIICADGPFVGFEHNSTKSTDGTLEYLQEQGCHVIEAGLCYEQDKLNMAFHKAAQLGFDFVLLLGSDEWPEGNIKEFEQGLSRLDKNPKIPYLAVKEHQPNAKWNRDIQSSPKLFVNPMFIRARHTHWCYYIYNQRTAFFECVIPGIVIHHDDTIRPRDRNKLMDNFQDMNVKREHEIVTKIELIQEEDSKQEISYDIMYHDFSTPRVIQNVMENGVTEWIVLGHVDDRRKQIFESQYKIHTWSDEQGYHVIPFRWSQRLKLE